MIRGHAAVVTGRAHRLHARERKRLPRMLFALSAVSFAAAGCEPAPICLTGREESAVYDRLARAFMAEKRIDPRSFRLARSIRLEVPVYHPQGMTKVDGHFFVSAVEVIERPPSDAGRKPECVQGSGRGHLFKFDENGNLIDQAIVGDGSIYHPGGIGYDGKHLWVPVAEYRPTVDPSSIG